MGRVGVRAAPAIVGQVRQVRRVGQVGQVRRVGQVYTKEVAKCVYEQLNKSTDVEEMLKILAEKMNKNQFTE